MKIDKMRLAIIILAVLLAVAVGYIIMNNLQEKRMEKEFEIYQSGMQNGYEQAILRVMEKAVTCQPVPLFSGNDTINMIAVECLQDVEGN